MEIKLQRENSQSIEIRSQFESSSQPCSGWKGGTNQAANRGGRRGAESGQCLASLGKGGSEGGYVMRQIWKA